jgi:hypothetical protein
MYFVCLSSHKTEMGLGLGLWCLTSLSTIFQLEDNDEKKKDEETTNDPQRNT